MISKDETILTKEQEKIITAFELKSDDEKNQYFQIVAQSLNIFH